MLERQKLAALGFTSSLETLPAEHADRLLVVSMKMDELRNRKRGAQHVD